MCACVYRKTEILAFYFEIIAKKYDKKHKENQNAYSMCHEIKWGPSP